MTSSSNTPSTLTLGTALVTGASAGIGAIYATRLAARGYDLILVARRADRLDALGASLHAAYGVQVTTLVADLTQAADLERVALQVEADRSLTLLVNNAGLATFGPVSATAAGALDAMTDVNITALVRLSRAAVVAFKQRNRGTLINIGSVLSFHSLPFSAAYSGAKGYVLNLTRGLQAEVEGTDVVVQLVAPGVTATDIWELSGVPLSSFDPAKVMSTEDLVDAALAGLDQGERITMPSVENAQLFLDYDNARQKLFDASQNGRPASRYQLAA